MAIISVSVDEKTMSDMDVLQRELELSGRSELIRACVRALATDLSEKSKMRGKVGGVLTVSHDEEEEGRVTKVKHRFEDIIKTHLHSKMDKGKCLEIFVLEGDSGKVAGMTKEFQRMERMENVKLVLT
jgi:CopG family nickel-responsive transcriptional regulator